MTLKLMNVEQDLPETDGVKLTVPWSTLTSYSGL